MLPLSDDVKKTLHGMTPKDVLPIHDGRLILYSSRAAAYLREKGFINIVIDKGGDIKSYLITDFENARIKVKFQEGMKKINASHIVSIELSNDNVYLYHWEGFITALDISSMNILEQKFTK